MNTRKPNRIPGWDYSSSGYYFVTFCTEKRKPILSSIRPKQDISPLGSHPPHRQTELEKILYQTWLSPIGIKTEEYIRKIEEKYPSVNLHHYVIMPNHVHLLLQIKEEEEGEAQRSLSVIIGQLKGAVRKCFPHPIWQKGFYDHVIRGEWDYGKKYRYIDKNPLIWLLKEDEYFNGK